MKNTALSLKDIPIQTVDIQTKTRLPNGKIAALLGALENEEKVPQSGAIIHITSAYDREGADLIALETALFAAHQEGKKTLFIDANPGTKNAATKAGLRPDTSLDECILDSSKSHAALLHINNTSCMYAKFSAQDSSGNLLLNTRILKELLNELRGEYDLVVVHSQDSIKSGVASILAPLADTSLIVIQADRTRMPVVQELIEIIKASGGSIAGTVMSGRKYYIPGWVYKLLFNVKSRD